MELILLLSNKDLFSEHPQRLNSFVMDTWCELYKSKFLEEFKKLSSNEKMTNNISHVWETEFKENILFNHVVLCYETSNHVNNKHYLDILRNSLELSECVADSFISWLGSKTGIEFLSKIFNINIEGNPNSFTLQSDMFENYHDVSKTNNYELVIEVIIDTLASWLNTHVGRCFISDAFQIDIPKHDPTLI